ncbi:MAG TPA: NADH-quinone oxidoreductase subunit K [Parvularculaceae bacterium]|nr:NADH-quinone oxidoreductase subunit K [Parvularculaceae bacterium]
MPIDFILERYNYWIFIILMMTGLYVVIARGNLVKKLIGLNIFQTSVFIYYISIGKIAGGTAPIILGGEGAGDHGAVTPPAATQSGAGDLHQTPGELANGASNLPGTAPPNEAAPAGAANLHEAPTANPPLTPPSSPAETAPTHFDIGVGAHETSAAHAANALHQAAHVIYTNPLPHVLILTAIVVGIATTAVGLALAVRIREAYGTIEEDELEAADDIAEFGHDMARETR